MTRLDQQDGSLDGKHRPQATDCACGARVSARSPICQFCGRPVVGRSVFDTI
ncbi:MAG: hypothetical protein ACK5PP_10650 [Acidimicrobiales bacterium]